MHDHAISAGMLLGRPPLRAKRRSDAGVNRTRKRIDSIDDQIVNLLNERAQVVRQVGLIKKNYKAPVSAPGREEAVLSRAAARAKAPLSGAAVEAIFRTMIREMSAMEQRQQDKAAKSR